MGGSDELTDDSFEHAIDKRIFKANRNTAKEKYADDVKRVAYHEAGHAVMTYLSGETVARASIIGSTGGVGGAVFQADKDTSGLTTKTEIEWQIKICYAGRAAESLVLCDISDGASNDITKATKLLNLYVTRMGMDDMFGAVDLEVLCPNMLESPALSRVQKLAERYMAAAQLTLRERLPELHAVANALIQKETLSGDEVSKLISESHIKGIV
jgi:cell division protease FtsH